MGDTAMSGELRYESLVRARAHRELIDAVGVAARKRLMTPSEFVRQALLRAVKEDGAVFAAQSVSGAA
jgi:hypothetical protein